MTMYSDRGMQVRWVLDGRQRVGVVLRNLGSIVILEDADGRIHRVEAEELLPPAENVVAIRPPSLGLVVASCSVGRTAAFGGGVSSRRTSMPRVCWWTDLEAQTAYGALRFRRCRIRNHLLRRVVQLAPGDAQSAQNPHYELAMLPVELREAHRMR
jgi:hypothetical protein